MLENYDDSYQLRMSLLLTRLNKKRPWLSQQSGVPIGTISGWYRGRIPRADHLLAVAKALDTTVEYLLDGSQVTENKSTPARARIGRWLDLLSDDEVEHLESSFKAFAQVTPLI